MTEPAYRLDLPEEGAWPAQGKWTYQDYLRLPEDGNRYEVIRGVLYVTPAPNFQGVPDLVLEVLSPSTRSRDRKVKLQAYQDAGVPEYWMVDPRTRTIAVNRLQGGRYVELCRGGVEERVRSAVISSFELRVARIFP